MQDKRRPSVPLNSNTTQIFPDRDITSSTENLLMVYIINNIVRIVGKCLTKICLVIPLQYRNKLNEQQNGRLSAQRAALGARQEEMRSIDRRVSELQARLVRKRALNRQLAAAHRQPQPQPQR